MEEREQEKKRKKLGAKGGDPERMRQAESLRLAKTELQRQMELTAHEARRKQLTHAIAELDKRIAQLAK